MTSSQPRVRRNEWGSLLVPPLGQWEPHLSVSVVMPAYGAHQTLPYVLAGLAEQSYPSHLMELIVVDDGAAAGQPPLELPDVRPDNARIITVEQGWGRANACHTGAMAAEGDVIHWLDADMLPERQHVEAQLRWHHEIDYGVVLGHKWFVDPQPLYELAPAAGARGRRRGPAGRLLRGPGEGPPRLGRAVVRPLRRPPHHRPARPADARRRDRVADPRPLPLLRRHGHLAAAGRGHRPGLPPRRGGRGVHPRPRGQVLAPRPHQRDEAARRGQRLQRRLPLRPPARAAQQASRRPPLLRAVPRGRPRHPRPGLPPGDRHRRRRPQRHAPRPQRGAGRVMGPARRRPVQPARRRDARHPADLRVVRRRPARPPGRGPARGPERRDVPAHAGERRLGAHPQDRRPAALQPRAQPPRPPPGADARRHDRARRAHRRGGPRAPRDQAGRVPRRRARRAVRLVHVRRGRGRLLAVGRGAPAADAGHRRPGRGPAGGLGLRRRPHRAGHARRLGPRGRGRGGAGPGSRRLLRRAAPPAASAPPTIRERLSALLGRR